MRRDRRRDARALVDRRATSARRRDRHATPPPRSGPARRRSGSPCAAGGPPSRPSIRIRVRFGWPVDADAHQVPRLALVPVGGRPDRDRRSAPARRRRASTCTRTRGAPCAQREQVVVDREALRLGLGQRLEALRHRPVEVAAAGGADVAGDALVAPVEVVGRRRCREEVEAVLVAQVLARLEEPRRLDDERRLAVRSFALRRRSPGTSLSQLGQLRPPRAISYAGGTPAWTASCRRMIPSISASGRGGQPGT